MKKRNSNILVAILLIYCVNAGLYAQQCGSIYSNLSTGFNRATQTPYTVSSPASFDPYWYVMKRQDVTLSFNPGPVYTPAGPITNFPANTLAYVITPYSSGFSTPYVIGTARHINLHSTWVSQYGTRNVVTYRTYFTLPALVPAIIYSLSFSLAADDGVYQVSVNGVDVKSPGFAGSGVGAAYLQGGSAMNLSVDSYNTPNAFISGSNYIDITIADLGLSAFFWEAEILLYQCTDPPPYPPSCGDCISSFAPIPGKKYVVSAWTKEKNAVQSKTSYTFPSIKIQYPSISGSAGPFSPTGAIIDGWQRIEGEFVIPSNATDMSVKLECTGANDCYFDDVRVFPFDGSMKSYVYDPVNMRLVAELDERNYATLYEYDEEGKLVRVKKETEKGKMTIKENRDNTQKQ